MCNVISAETNKQKSSFANAATFSSTVQLLDMHPVPLLYTLYLLYMHGASARDVVVDYLK